MLLEPCCLMALACTLQSFIDTKQSNAFSIGMKRYTLRSLMYRLELRRNLSIALVYSMDNILFSSLLRKWNFGWRAPWFLGQHFSRAVYGVIPNSTASTAAAEQKNSPHDRRLLLQLQLCALLKS